MLAPLQQSNTPPRHLAVLAVFATIFILCGQIALAQVSLGLPRYSSVSGGPDVINLSNLNMHLSIPLVQRVGRGINFAYSMEYDSAFYAPINSGNGATWQPQGSSMGWNSQGVSSPKAYVLPLTVQTTGCPGQGGQQVGVGQYSDFIFVDRMGALHPFAATIVSAAGPCPGYSQGYNGFSNVPSADHSGILLSTIITNSQGSQTLTLQVTMPDGSTAVYPWLYSGNSFTYNPGYFGDNNGNFISNTANAVYSVVSGPAGTGPSSKQLSFQGGTWTDTLGNNPALSVPLNGVISYTYGSGATATVTPHATDRAIATNFGCANVKEYTASAALMDTLTLADGRKYTFSYEASTGSATTGRIVGIGLPSGGTITYAYTTVGGVSINCNTGAPLGFTRTVTDGLGNSYPTVYTYTQQNLPITNTTTVTDPSGASVVHSFAAIVGSLGPSSYGQELVETSAVAKNSSGTVLKTVSINYNGGPASAVIRHIR